MPVILPPVLEGCQSFSLQPPGLWVLAHIHEEPGPQAGVPDPPGQLPVSRLPDNSQQIILYCLTSLGNIRCPTVYSRHSLLLFPSSVWHAATILGSSNNKPGGRDTEALIEGDGLEAVEVVLHVPLVATGHVERLVHRGDVHHHHLVKEKQ